MERGGRAESANRLRPRPKKRLTIGFLLALIFENPCIVLSGDRGKCREKKRSQAEDLKLKAMHLETI